MGPNCPGQDQELSIEEATAIEDGNLNVREKSMFSDKDESCLFQKMSSSVEGVEGKVPQ
jgi:hypothetical protein